MGLFFLGEVNPGLFFLGCALWPLLCVLGGIIGSRKNRTWEGVYWGFLLGPWGIIIISLQSVDYANKCPECCLGIPKLATRCGHCGAALSPPALCSLPAVIRFSCPQCHKNYSAPEERAGAVGTCCGCGTKMKVPLVSDTSN